MPLFFLIDAVCLGISMVLSAALLLIVLGAGAKKMLNASFAFFSALMCAWATSSLLLRFSLWFEVGNPLPLSEIAALTYALIPPVLVVFATRFTEMAKPRVSDTAVLAGIIALVLLAIPLFNHQIVLDVSLDNAGTATPDLSRLGFLAAIIPGIYFLWALTVFSFRLKKKGDVRLFLSILFLILGFAIRGLGQVNFPVISIINMTSLIIIGYAILDRQLFNPLKESTQALEATVQERTEALKNANEEVEGRIEERTRELNREVEERRKAEELIRKRAGRLELVHEIGQRTTIIHNLDDLLHDTSDLIRSTFGFHQVSIMLIEGNKLVLKATSLDELKIMENRFSVQIMQEGITGWVAGHGNPLVVPDVNAEPLYRKAGPESHTLSELAVPIKYKTQVIGVLDIQSSELNAFSEVDTSTMQTVADQLAIAIENARLYREMQEELEVKEKTAAILRESEEKFRNLAEQSPNMIFINKKGKVVFANAKCQELIGYTREEFYSDEFDFTSIVHKDYQELIEHNYKENLKGRDVPPYEYALITKSGERIETIITTKRMSYEGETAILGIVTDITSRKKAEVLLQTLNSAAAEIERAQYTENISAVIGEALREIGCTCTIFISAKAGEELVLEYHSFDGGLIRKAEKLTNFSSKGFALRIADTPLFTEIISKSETIVIDGIEALNSIMPRPIRQFSRQIVNLLNIPRSIAAPLIAENEVIGVFTVQSDNLSQEDVPAITAFANLVAAAWRRANLFQDLLTSLDDLKRTQEQLILSQKMEAMGVLAGGIAHDFNNLLGVITGYTNLLLIKEDLEAAVHDDLEEIKNAAFRASDLTRQLLAFSRRQVLQPKTINLNHIVVNMENMLGRLLGERIQLKTVLHKNGCVIEADPGQIEQVIMNLSVNAKDAMQEGGELAIKTLIEELDQDEELNSGLYAVLQISDNGSGMEENTKKHLFEPFFTTKESGRGTGLGLATVHGIVAQSGGAIRFASDRGNGTTFKIYFPTGSKSDETAIEAANSKTSTKRTETILIVEDENSLLELAVRLLSNRGYNVLKAIDGEKAMRVFHEYSGLVHLLVTDLELPGEMKGNNLAEKIAQLSPDTRFLYMSGYAENQNLHKILAGDSADFLQKPYTPDGFLKMVENMLGVSS